MDPTTLAFDLADNSKQTTDVEITIQRAFKLYCDVVSPGQEITKHDFLWMWDYCKKRGLDLLAKDVHFVTRRTNDRGTWKKTLIPQTSIDGFRKIAASSGEYDGHDLFWCDVNGDWRDVWLLDNPPVAAKVVVYRKGCIHSFPAVARFSEYAQKSDKGELTRSWRTMPALMIAKCAEALALRKAFPQQLGGIHTDEEAQVESRSAFMSTPAPSQSYELPKPIDTETEELKTLLFQQLIGKGGKFDGKLALARGWVQDQAGKSYEELTADDTNDLLAALEREENDNLDG